MDGLDSGSSSDPECEPNFAHNNFGEKCENPLCQAHLRVLHHQLESEKMNLEDVTICSTIRSEMRFLEEGDAVERCPEEKP